MKSIIICADGTWNRPEEEIGKDFPTNVLKFSRGIRPRNNNGEAQIIFYDWGIGSYHQHITGGAFGAGLDKIIKDCYRFIIHNYNKGDRLYFFGFSRGAYTVRSLCGFINNCGIIKNEHGNRVEQAYNLYRNRDIHPKDEVSMKFREYYAHADKTEIHFVGVWDTVGALGVPLSVFSFVNDKHMFHDLKIGKNIITARHALSVDEMRADFRPTIWNSQKSRDLKQVWFPGVHSDVGGGYEPDSDGAILSNISLHWMIKEAKEAGLSFYSFMQNEKQNPLATKHEEYKGKYKLLGKHLRKIHQHTKVHISVKIRYENDKTYRPYPIETFLKANNKWPDIEYDE